MRLLYTSADTLAFYSLHCKFHEQLNCTIIDCLAVMQRLAHVRFANCLVALILMKYAFVENNFVVIGG